MTCAGGGSCRHTHVGLCLYDDLLERIRVSEGGNVCECASHSALTFEKWFYIYSWTAFNLWVMLRAGRWIACTDQRKRARVHVRNTPRERHAIPSLGCVLCSPHPHQLYTLTSHSSLIRCQRARSPPPISLALQTLTSHSRFGPGVAQCELLTVCLRQLPG